MKYFYQFIAWVALALLMIASCIMDAILGHWFVFAICALAFVCDVISAFLAFILWRCDKARRNHDT